MANWFAVGKLQGFARESDGAFVSFAAAATAWPGDEEIGYLFVPDYTLVGDTVVFAPGAVEKELRTYGLPADQDRVNAACERALTADPVLVAAMQAEMDRRDRAELKGFFPCPDCTRFGIGKA